jgi:DNA-nicking Smr family endonuclease
MQCNRVKTLTWTWLGLSADKQAKFRGEAFAESQKAYKSGNKAAAKELSNKGKAHGQAMEQANRNAVHSILAPQRSSETGCLDLHGLYVQEAVDASKEFLQYHMSKGLFGEVEIITGAGHHSENNKAKIKPEVEKLLRQKRLKYVIPQNNDGCIHVTLRAQQ